jgi:pyruvate,water dikinase
MVETVERTAEQRFPSPFEIATPAGAEGWQRMYPYYLLFSEENREWEDSMLWFQDGMHHPEVLYPFDTITHECWRVALGQYNTRVFSLPAYGIEQRVVNGYLYICAVPVSDPNTIPARIEVFLKRAGEYYGNWNRYFDEWKVKMTRVIDDLKGLGSRACRGSSPRASSPRVSARPPATTSSPPTTGSSIASFWRGSTTSRC